MLRRSLTLLAILGLLCTALPATAVPAATGPAGPAGAGLSASHPSAGSAFTALGCYRDDQGDAALPEADLVEMCVNAIEDDPSVIVVSFDAVAPFTPLSDPAWEDPGTGVSVDFSIDEDDTVDHTFTITRDGGGMVAALTDEEGDPVEGCGELAAVRSGFLLGQFSAACIGEPDALRAAATLRYQPAGGGAPVTDRVPGDGLTAPLPFGDEAPVCANATVQEGTQLAIRRLACGIGGTEPISQAVATSQFVFDDPDTAVIDPAQASWVVLARDDDFADALAGSTLSFGQGPLLFTYSPSSVPPGQDPGRLADITRAEILRVLPRGRTVYLLGGEAALAPGLEDQLTDLGYVVQRFAGTGREATARLIAGEVAERVDEFAASTGFIDTNMVLIANRANWPDAVLAGSVGAFWGMPILLVDAAAPVHPETLAALDELRPDYIHVVGGVGVISNEAGGAIGQHARGNGYALGRAGEDLTGPRWGSFCGGSFVCRWGGNTRLETGAATTQLNRDMLQRFSDQRFIPPNPQQYAVALNLSGGVDSANFAYVLSAATVSGRFGGAVFIPTEDQTIAPSTRNALCNTPGSEGFVQQVEDLVVAADTDLVSDSFTAAIRTLVEQGC